MKKYPTKKHQKLSFSRLAFAVANIFIALLFCTCSEVYWDDEGIFKSINNEIKLYNGVVKGNIMSLVEYDGRLYAAGGKIYSKDIAAVRGWSEASKPSGLVVRLAASNTHLYALTATTNVDDVTTKRLYGRTASGGWTPIQVTGAIKTIFSNNALTASNRLAYITTDSGVYPLTSLAAVGSSGLIASNGASASSVAAAFLTSGSATHFSSSAAFTSDGTNVFEGSGTNISYGTTSLTPVAISGISQIYSLYAHGGYLYVGTKSGVKRVKITSNEPESASESFGSNTAAAVGSYEIPAIFATDETGGITVYASTIANSTSLGSKNNCLWGYYATGSEQPNTWNRE